MFFRLIVGAILVGSLAGCATTQKPTAVNNLQIRVAQIENQMDERKQDITELKYAVEELAMNVEKLADSVKATREPSKTTSNTSPNKSEVDSQAILRVPVTPQEVQTALKNAGYYDGAIDGKLGSGSQAAVKSFQTDHDLESDGIVGKKTWVQLKNYLE